MRVFPYILIVLILTGCTIAQDSNSYSTKVNSLLEKAKKHNPERYKFAFDKGAKVFQTADGNSFYLLWYQADVKTDKTLIVTMHGSLSYAFDEFYLWYEKAKKHGHGILALQWWFEGNPPPRDYYFPNESYRAIDLALKQEQLKQQKALFHGFSRASANSYYVALFDRESKNNYFLLNLANSGGASEGYPMYRDVVAEKFGKTPLAGTNWATFCGYFDQNPERDGCPAMRRTGEFIKKYGGEVKLAIEDEKGDHGLFHKNPQLVDKALDLFDEMLKKQ